MNPLLAFLLLPQTGIDPVPPGPVAPEEQALIHLVPEGGIEAPAQPSRASSARVETGERSMRAAATRTA